MPTAILSEQERSARASLLLHEVDTNVRTLWEKCISLGRALFSVLFTTLGSIKDFSAKYPAVLSGYIIYSYLFITMIHFFLKAKSRELTLYEIYETFSALPFMWLLASALVKIIGTRAKLHDSEKERILYCQELEIKQTQLSTMHEVAKGFQHRINNPLTIISLTLSGTRRAVAGNPVVLERLSCIEESAKRIQQAVTDFSRAEKYEVEHIGSVVGYMASPASLRPPTDTGMSFQRSNVNEMGSISSRPEEDFSGCLRTS
jgi:signal transduction histidine kinase